MTKGVQRVQTSSYKISTGDIMYSMTTIVNTAVWYLKVAKKVDLKSSHNKGKKMFSYMRWWRLTYCGSHFIIYINPCVVHKFI